MDEELRRWVQLHLEVEEDKALPSNVDDEAYEEDGRFLLEGLLEVEITTIADDEDEELPLDKESSHDQVLQGEADPIVPPDTRKGSDQTKMDSAPSTPSSSLTYLAEDLTSPRQFFDLIFRGHMINLIVTRTNLYAKALKDKCTLPKARIKSWVDLTIDEFMVFIGLLFHMGTIRIAQLADYWSSDRQLFDLRPFRQCMSRDRFMSILSCLHFAPIPDTTDPLLNRDRLYKIRPLIDIFNDTMEQIYVPITETLFKDESTILWRGRLSFHQCNKYKPYSNGINMYMLNEPTGLVLRFLVYTGDEDINVGGVEHTEMIVKKLMDGKFYKGYKFTMDNHYTPVRLVKRLLDLLMYCAGNMSSNRLTNSHESVSVEPAKGKRVQGIRNDGVCVMKWKDKGDILMVRTEYTDAMIKVTTGKDFEADKVDQMMSHYPIERNSLKWFRKLAVHVMHLCMVNAYFIYSKRFPGMSLYDFRLSVIRTLLPPSLTQQSSCGEDFSHYPERIGGKEGVAPPRPKYRRCKECWAYNRRRETQYLCHGCPDRPALCVYPCFRDHHRQ